jgi:hypothetical protein
VRSILNAPDYLRFGAFKSERTLPQRPFQVVVVEGGGQGHTGCVPAVHGVERLHHPGEGFTVDDGALEAAKVM